MDRRPADTRSGDYTRRLVRLQSRDWKRRLDVQAPYRRHLRGLELGHMLDVGCGIGRNLAHCGGQGIGVDHNPESVAIARDQGFEAYLDSEFRNSPKAHERAFDSLLFSHILEHMDAAAATRLVRDYLPLLRPAGRVIAICPQEAGFRSDPSHVAFCDFEALRAIAQAVGLAVENTYSVPFPRFVGRFFRHNEFVLIARKPAAP